MRRSWLLTIAFATVGLATVARCTSRGGHEEVSLGISNRNAPAVSAESAMGERAPEPAAPESEADARDGVFADVEEAWMFALNCNEHAYGGLSDRVREVDEWRAELDSDSKLGKRLVEIRDELERTRRTPSARACYWLFPSWKGGEEGSE